MFLLGGVPEGGASFEVPAEKRSDQLVVRGARLPWAKFPRHPEL